MIRQVLLTSETETGDPREDTLFLVVGNEVLYIDQDAQVIPHTLCCLPVRT